MLPSRRKGRGPTTDATAKKTSAALAVAARQASQPANVRFRAASDV